MSSHSFLIARPDKRPVFSSPDGANEIAHASDWIPLGWLAMFEPRDVQLVEEPPESHSYDPETITRCPTLVRKKDAAIDMLQKRRAKLSKILPQHLQDQLARTQPNITIVRVREVLERGHKAGDAVLAQLERRAVRCCNFRQMDTQP